jgi:hypothetical protein
LQQESCKSSSHVSIDYRKKNCSKKKKKVMNLQILIMNIHMHRMMSQSILINCLVIMIELLGVGNSKITAYGFVHITIEL